MNKKTAIAFVLTSAIGVSLVACSPSEQPESPLPAVTTTQPQQGLTEPSRGATGDEAADVTAVRLGAPDPAVPTWHYIETEVTNHSSKTSDYWIELSVVSADNSLKYGTDWVIINGLEPNQSTTERSLSSITDIPANAVIKVVNVDRTESL